MNDATRGLLARALAVLRAVEWEGLPILHPDPEVGDMIAACSWCGVGPHHADDCDLKRAMDDLGRAIGEGEGER